MIAEFIATCTVSDVRYFLRDRSSYSSTEIPEALCARFFDAKVNSTEIVDVARVTENSFRRNRKFGIFVKPV